MGPARSTLKLLFVVFLIQVFPLRAMLGGTIFLGGDALSRSFTDGLNLLDEFTENFTPLAKRTLLIGK